MTDMANHHTFFVDGAARGRIFSGMEGHIVDCDALPRPLDGWKIDEHRQHGKKECTSRHLMLWRSSDQEDGKEVSGFILYDELTGKAAANWNVLSHFLEHPRLIPEDWKGRRIYFWGTVFRDTKGNHRVCCLCWDTRGWDWRSSTLDSSFGKHDVAAVFLLKS